MTLSMSSPPQSTAHRRRFRKRHCDHRRRATPSRRRPPRWVLRFARRLLAAAHRQDVQSPDGYPCTQQDIRRLHRFHCYAAWYAHPMLTQARVVSRNLLVLFHARLVRYTISSLVINTQEEMYDDMFQTGVIALMRAIDKFDIRKRSSFSSYACIVIRNDLIAMMRCPRVRLSGTHWRPMRYAPMHEQCLGAHDGGIASLEESIWLDEVLDGMGEFDRSVAVKRYVEGLSVRQAAIMLDVSISAVTSAERRIKRHFADRLRDHRADASAVG